MWKELPRGVQVLIVSILTAIFAYLGINATFTEQDEIPPAQVETTGEETQ